MPSATDVTFQHRTCVEFQKFPWFTITTSDILSRDNDMSLDLTKGHVPVMLVSSTHKLSQIWPLCSL